MEATEKESARPEGANAGNEGNNEGGWRDQAPERRRKLADNEEWWI